MTHASKSINVALIQEGNYPSLKESYSHFETKLLDAKRQGAQLVLLPELHGHPYFPNKEDTNNFDLAESIPGPSTDFYSALAKKLELVLVLSVFERRAPGLYHNTAVVIENDGTLAGMYRKMHIPDDPGYSEKFYFTPGDLGFTPISTSVGKLGVLVCWDQWFPEAARIMALKGADLLLYPTAIGWDPVDTPEEQARQLDAWITIQRAHAIANGIPILSCNRVGIEQTTPFWGNSFIAGSQGEMLARANDTDASLLVSTLSSKRSEDIRRIWPFLRDRRIDAYDDLLKRFSETP